jgi:hypothetical protein
MLLVPGISPLYYCWGNNMFLNTTRSFVGRYRNTVLDTPNNNKNYAAAQNMSTTHFISSCTAIPKDLRSRLASLRGIREMGKVGNNYWMDSCRDIMGIAEHDGALWWKKDEGRLWSRGNTTNNNTGVGVVVGPTTTGGAAAADTAGATTQEESKDTRTDGGDCAKKRGDDDDGDYEEKIAAAVGLKKAKYYYNDNDDSSDQS